MIRRSAALTVIVLVAYPVVASATIVNVLDKLGGYSQNICYTDSDPRVASDTPYSFSAGPGSLTFTPYCRIGVNGGSISLAQYTVTNSRGGTVFQSATNFCDGAPLGTTNAVAMTPQTITLPGNDTYTVQGHGAGCNGWAIDNYSLAAYVDVSIPPPVQTCVQTTQIGNSKRIYLTCGTSWTVPSDWNNSNNTIETIGGGGGGGYTIRVGAGSGGAYSLNSNVALAKNTAVAYSVGVGGSVGNNGGDTYFCNSSANCSSLSSPAVVVGAQGGTATASWTAAAGGAAGSGIGSVRYSGGNGGLGAQGGGFYGPGGGGAAGPNGNRSAGSDYVYGTGGNADANAGGTGGAGGGRYTTGGVGGNGAEWDASHGSGGGGGGGGLSGAAGGGGAYGGGGGGPSTYAANGAAGGAGIIVITYTPSTCGSILGSTADNGGFSLFTGIVNRLLSGFGSSYCISNASGFNYFIPAHTQAELQSFLNAIPRLTGVTTSTP